MMVQRTNLVLPTGVPRACRLRFRICFAALAAATMAFHVGNAGGEPPPSDSSAAVAARGAGYVPGELLVKLGSSPARLQTANSPHDLVGATVLGSFPAIGWEHVRLPEGMTVGQGIKAYLALPGVLAAEPNYTLEL